MKSYSSSKNQIFYAKLNQKYVEKLEMNILIHIMEKSVVLNIAIERIYPTIKIRR